MSLPPNGWVLPTYSELELYPLPEVLNINYQDAFIFGKVSALRVHRSGHPVVFDNSGFRLIDIDIQITSVYDVVLLDRIE